VASSNSTDVKLQALYGQISGKAVFEAKIISPCSVTRKLPLPPNPRLRQNRPYAHGAPPRPTVPPRHGTAAGGARATATPPPLLPAARLFCAHPAARVPASLAESGIADHQPLARSQNQLAIGFQRQQGIDSRGGGGAAGAHFGFFFFSGIFFFFFFHFPKKGPGVFLRNQGATRIGQATPTFLSKQLTASTSGRDSRSWRSHRSPAIFARLRCDGRGRYPAPRRTSALGLPACGQTAAAVIAVSASRKSQRCCSSQSALAPVLPVRLKDSQSARASTSVLPLGI